MSLELQETRAKRELQRLNAEDADSERQRAETRRAEALANKRALAEERLQREREAERRERERRESEARRRRSEFHRGWLQRATDRVPAWASFEQRQTLLASVEEGIETRNPEDGELISASC